MTRILAVTLSISEYMARSLADDSLAEVLGEEAVKAVKKVLAEDEKLKAYQRIKDAEVALQEARQAVLNG